MASTRTICTECKSVVTLPEPAEVGDVVACPKCEAYFTVPKTKIVPTPGAAKPAPAKPAAAVVAKPKPKVVVEAEAVDDEDFVPPPPKKKPVVVVEDDEDEEEEEEEKPKKKKKRPEGGGSKKKKKKKDDEGSFRNSPLRYAILGVLVLVMLVGAYFLYKKMMKGDPPEIVITKPEEDFSKPIPGMDKKGGSPGMKTGLPSVDRKKAENDLKQLGIAYVNYTDSNGMGPKAPADLLPFVENNAKLIKDVTDGVYVLAMGVRPALLPQGSSNTILGYVHDVPQKGGVVLFADTAVRNVRKDEFDAAPKAGK